MKLNLGFKPKYWDGMGATSAPKESKKEKKEAPTCYPQISLQGDAADSLIEKVDADDIITATVKMRVVRITSKAASHTEYGSSSDEGASVDLEVISMEGVEIEDDKDDEKEETADEAVDKYRKEKSGK